MAPATKRSRTESMDIISPISRQPPPRNSSIASDFMQKHSGARAAVQDIQPARNFLSLLFGTSLQECHSFGCVVVSELSSQENRLVGFFPVTPDDASPTTWVVIDVVIGSSTQGDARVTSCVDVYFAPLNLKDDDVHHQMQAIRRDKVNTAFADLRGSSISYKSRHFPPLADSSENAPGLIRCIGLVALLSQGLTVDAFSVSAWAGAIANTEQARNNRMSDYAERITLPDMPLLPQADGQSERLGLASALLRCTDVLEEECQVLDQRLSIISRFTENVKTIRTCGSKAFCEVQQEKRAIAALESDIMAWEKIIAAQTDAVLRAELERQLNQKREQREKIEEGPQMREKLLTDLSDWVRLTLNKANDELQKCITAKEKNLSSARIVTEKCAKLLDPKEK